jgi:DNA-binding transcriptional ArsR family regulator
MSTTPFEELAGLDRLIHEPTRLAILTALAACERADFLFLQRITSLTKGNLSAHLSKLEAARLITIEKRLSGNRPQTMIALSGPGREALEAYWQELDAARERARRWRPQLAPEPA